MSWDAGFVELLEQSCSAAFMLHVEPLLLGEEIGVADYRVASAPVRSFSFADSTCALVADTLRGVMASLDPSSWSATLGGYTVQVAGNLATFLGSVRRGSVVTLHVILEAADGHSAAGERVHVGVVTAIEGARTGGAGAAFDSVAVTVLDLPAALGQRLGAPLGSRQLFGGSGSSTTANGAQAVGADPYVVTSTALLPMPRTGYGIVLVSPSSGDEYWRIVDSTGVTATDLEIVDEATVSQLGTTDVGCSNGDEVTGAWFVYGEPFNAVRKILCTVGDGSNGSYDVLYSLWGLGVPDHWIDHDNIDMWRDTVLQPATGIYLWELASTEGVDDGYSWLSSLLASAGMWMCIRQGSFVLHCVQSAWATSGNPNIHSGIVIGAADVLTVDALDLYDTRRPVEYERVHCLASGSIDQRDSTEATTAPSELTWSVDWSDRLFTNLTAVLERESARLLEQAVTIPTRVELVCAGLRCARLSLGELVELDLPMLPNRWEPALGLAGYRAHVIGIGIDWGAGTVRLVLSVPPRHIDETP